MRLFLDLQKKIGYQFNDINILKNALIHPSSNIEINYERLEFLGDSLIGAVVSEFIYKKFLDNNQGELSKQKSSIVNRSNLSRVSQKLNIIENAYLGQSITKSDKSTIEKINCDLYESLVAAVYLDSDYETVKNIIINTLLKKGFSIDDINSKGDLIELCSKLKIKKPVFEFKKNNLNGSSKIFCVALKVKNMVFKGYGARKKIAENDASKKALHFLGF